MVLICGVCIVLAILTSFVLAFLNLGYINKFHFYTFKSRLKTELFSSAYHT